MFGFNADNVTVTATEIDGTVYVPYHVEGANGRTLTTFLSYEDMQEQVSVDSTDTSQYRYDADEDGEFR